VGACHQPWASLSLTHWASCTAAAEFIAVHVWRVVVQSYDDVCRNSAESVDERIFIAE